MQGPAPPQQRPPQQQAGPSPFDEGTGGLNRNQGPNYSGPPSSGPPQSQYSGPPPPPRQQSDGSNYYPPPQQQSGRGDQYPPPSSGSGRPNIPEWGPGPAGVQEAKRSSSEYPNPGNPYGGGPGANTGSPGDFHRPSGPPGSSPGSGYQGGPQSSTPSMYPTVSR